MKYVKIKRYNLKSNCGTTLQKFYNPYKEQVYKLNLEHEKHNNQNQNKSSLSNSLNIKKTNNNNKYYRVLEINEFLNSVEKIKKILPDIKIVNSKSNYKVEDKLFKRYEHQELENIFKEKMRKNSNKKEELMKELYMLRNDLKEIEDNISDITLDLNIFNDVNKYLCIRNENKNKKKFKRRSRYFKTLKINKKIFESDSDIKKELNNSKENNTPRNRINSMDKNEIFNFNSDSNNETAKTNIYNSVNSTINIKINNMKIISYINKNKKSKMISLNSKLTELKKKKKEITKEIKLLEEEKKKINLENEEIKMKLYNHYLRLLKEGEDSRNDGLSWIIKEIFSLGKNVLISYLPKFLDEYGIAFLFQQAKIYEKLDNCEQKIISIKKELTNLGVVKNFEKTESIWKKVEGTEFLGNDFKKTYSNEPIKNKIINKLKCKHLFKSIINKRYINNNYSNYNNMTKSNENSFNNIIKNLNSYSSNKQNLLISRNESINSKDNRILSFSSRKSYILNYNLKQIQKYKHNLSINEIKKLLKDTKIKVDKKIIDKIREYMEINKTKKKIKKLLIEMRNEEIQRILDEYSKRSYYQRFMVEKNIVLSALIGEDNLGEINKQLVNGKIYFNKNFLNK